MFERGESSNRKLMVAPSTTFYGKIWVGFCPNTGTLSEAATRGVLCKKMFLEISQNSQESTCARVSILINFIKKEALAQVFSCEFCEISKNTSGRLLLRFVLGGLILKPK